MVPKDMAKKLLLMQCHHGHFNHEYMFVANKHSTEMDISMTLH